MSRTLLAGAVLVAALLAAVPASASVADGRIVFSSERSGDRELYSMRPDGSGVRRLTHEPGDDERADVSPDGRRIVWTHRPPGADRDLWVMDADGGGKTRLTTQAGSDVGAQFSPDGKRIAFSSSRDGGYDELFVMDADGANETQLTSFPWTYRIFGPAWSPDGGTLLFVSDGATRGWETNIWSLDLATRAMKRLTATADADDDFASYAPDGRSIVFRRSHGGSSHIYRMNPDGTGQSALTTTGRNTMPVLSPDGSRIAFTTFPVTRGQIAVMRADGSDRRQLTHDEVGDEWPAWGPARDDAAPVSAAAVAPQEAADGWHDADPVTVTLRADDGEDGSGVRSLTWRAEGAQPGGETVMSDEAVVRVAAEGETRIRFAATDVEGNAERERTVTVRVDRTAPESSVPVADPEANGDGWHRADAKLRLAASDAGAGVRSLRYQVGDDPVRTHDGPGAEVPVTGEGTTTIRYRAIDRLGHESGERTATVRLDRTAPEVAAAPADMRWHAGEVRVELEARDALSGLRSLEWWTDAGERHVAEDGRASVTVRDEGTTSVHWEAVDRAGNVTEGTLPVQIDDTQPTVTAVPSTPANGAGWNNEDVTVHLTASDDLSGLKRLDHALSGAQQRAAEGGSASSAQVLVDREGETTIAYEAEDLAGNVRRGEIVVRLDKTAPDAKLALSAAPNEAGWHAGPVDATVTATDPLSGVRSLECSTDEDERCEAAADGSARVTVRREGTTDVRYAAVDRAGNVMATKTLPVHIDKTKPTIDPVLSAPANGAGWHDRDVTVDLTAADALSGLKRLRYELSGAQERAAEQETSPSRRIVVDREGVTKITYEAEDLAGHVREGELVVRLDKTAPDARLALATAPNAAGWHDGIVEAAVTATDAGSGVVGVTRSATGAGELAEETVAGGEARVTIDAEGITTLRFTAIDAAGNRSPERERSVRIDRTPPKLACSPAPAALWPPNGKLLPVAVDVRLTDERSGADGFTLTAARSSESGGDEDVVGFEVGTPDQAGQLRAERDGDGPGRTYTLAYTGRDKAGNAGRCEAVVAVAHDRGGAGR